MKPRQSDIAAGLRAHLVMSARNRRAIDETLADWAFERERAASPARRLLVDVRGGAAVTAALLCVAAVEARQRSSWATVAFAGLIAGGFSVGTLWAMVPVFLSQFPLSVVLLLSAAMVPSGMTVCLAPVLAALLLRQGVAVLGTMTAAVAVMIVLAGWITPEANQWFRQTSFVAGTQTVAGAQVLPRGANELTLIDLVAGASGMRPELAEAARRQLVLKAGLIAWTAAGCLLAGCVRPLVQNGHRRHWARVILPVAMFATVAAASGMRAWIGMRVEFVIWIAVVVALLVTGLCAMAIQSSPPPD
jgi:hypothetical protein